MSRVLSLSLLAAVASFIGPPDAAAGPDVEVGTSLTSMTIGLGDNNSTVVGVPTTSFGVVGCGVYGAFFVTRRVALEPQIGMLVVSAAGETLHFVNLAAQADYLLNGKDRRSPYLFGAIGMANASVSQDTPKSVGVGIGYRIPMERAVIRLDARHVRIIDRGGSAVTLGISIGGLF